MKILRNYRIWLTITIVALLAGNVVGWGTIAIEVRQYCSQFGSFWALTDFSGDLVENPLLTPCFYGSIAFLVSIIWSVKLYFLKDEQKLAKSVKYLVLLLIAGTVFAAINNIPVFQQFYFSSEEVVSCTGSKVTNPFITSCFLGFSAYFVASIGAICSQVILSNRTKS